MGKILFRGKSKDSGEWLEGSLLYVNAKYYIVDKYAWMDYGEINGGIEEVIPETVGRLVNDPCYTDYTDQRYFQGDIVELNGKWSTGTSCVRRIGIVNDEHSFIKNGFVRCFPQDTMQARVIGNVWDNPELVGKESAVSYIRRFHYKKVDPLSFGRDEDV